MDFKKLVRETKKIDKLFKKRFDKRDRVLDLVEEVGELVQAMQIVEKRKLTNDPAKQKYDKDVVEEICHILYDLILISEYYKVDLTESYKEMIMNLEERIKKGEFDER